MSYCLAVSMSIGCQRIKCIDYALQKWGTEIVQHSVEIRILERTSTRFQVSDYRKLNLPNSLPCKMLICLFKQTTASAVR